MGGVVQCGAFILLFVSCYNIATVSNLTATVVFTLAAGQSLKPMTIAPNAFIGCLLFRWGSFDPQELARFSKLLDKLVRLKPGWPDNKDMAT
ncbi:hypothetical protein PVK06_022436 [Gossypium arboreum]|uniref:Uncharacterized protein n=1 Tax=Gossypium arboreum TaxID=29729 RepID=A0ABR0P8K4_GOSAR|nr:hypothetical protein PVK06_022436 [Gossypium arboreum]